MGKSIGILFLLLSIVLSDDAVANHRICPLEVAKAVRCIQEPLSPSGIHQNLDPTPHVLDVRMESDRTLLLFEAIPKNRSNVSLFLFDSGSETTRPIDSHFRRGDFAMLTDDGKVIHEREIGGKQVTAALPLNGSTQILVGTNAGKLYLTESGVAPTGKNKVMDEKEPLLTLAQIPGSPLVLASFEQTLVLFNPAKPSRSRRLILNTSIRLDQNWAQLTDTPPAISDDGRTALMVMEYQSDRSDPETAVIKVDLEKLKVTVLATPILRGSQKFVSAPQVFQSEGETTGLYFAWSNAGGTMLHIRPLAGGPPEMYLINAAEPLSAADLATTAVSPDGRLIATPTQDGDVIIFDRPNQRLRTIRYAKSADSSFTTLKIFRMKSFEKRLRILTTEGLIYEVPVDTEPQ